MITLDKELLIHEALDDRRGRGFHTIARELGIPKTNVVRIHVARKKAGSIPGGKFSEVRSLLLAGLSAEKVSVKANIPRDVVVAIRRVTCAQMRRSKHDPQLNPTTCPTCGAPVLPACSEEHTPNMPPKKFRHKNSLAMFSIVDDVIGLGCAGVIHNFLFLDLVKRSRAAIAEMIGEANE